jgi:hypothetical protein
MQSRRQEAINNLVNKVNTARFAAENLITELNITDNSQKNWLYSSNNSNEVSNLSDFLQNNRVHGVVAVEAMNFAKEAIEALKDGAEVDYEEELIYDSSLDEYYINRMSIREKEIFDGISIYQKTQYLMSAQQASNYAKKYNESIYNGKGDAVRHAFWNALSTVRLGETLTKQLTDAHEENAFQYSNHYKEKQMDLFNNAIGRQIALGQGKLYQLIEQALANGDLRYLSHLLGGGQSGRATNQSQLTPTNQ